MEAHGLSVVRACRVAGLSRAAYYRPPQDRVERDAPVIEALTAVAAAHTSWGFWKCFGRLRLPGHAWNAKRVYRVYAACTGRCASTGRAGRSGACPAGRCGRCSRPQR